MVRRRAAVILVAALFATSCTTAPTALQVVIDVDPSIQPRMRGIRVQVFRPATSVTPIDQHLFPIAAGWRYPFSLDVLSGSGAGSIRVDVSGFDESGAGAGARGFVQAQAIVDFVAGETRTVSLALFGRCADLPMPCGAGATCNAAGACESAVRGTTPYSPALAAACPAMQVRLGAACVTPAPVLDAATSDAPPFDTSPRDVGPETAVDTSATDGVTDAGPGDLGVIDAGTVDARPLDLDRPDVGAVDAAMSDGGPADARPNDNSPVDTGSLDSGPVDTGRVDAGPVDAGPLTCAAGFELLGGRCVGASAPRPIAPISLGDVSLRRPTLVWELPSGMDGVELSLCGDRACTVMIEAPRRVVGTRTRPSSALPAGSVVFWRLRGTYLFSSMGRRVDAAFASPSATLIRGA